MWLRRAVRIPWNLIGAIGAVTVLSVTAVTFPVKALSSILRKPAVRDLQGRTTRRRLMPEVYDAQEVAVMLQMVQAAMQHKSQQLHLEHSASVQLQQQVDGLQESLENMSYLFAQEQQHRLGLQAELQAAESAATDLRQMLAVFFGDTPGCSPDSTSEAARARVPELVLDSAWSSSSPSQLRSGLPGTLDRRDSRLQTDLAGIQKRLHKIAQLRDTPPSSPRSGERISSWASPSSADGASPRSPDLGRSRTLGSRLSPVKLSPLRTATMTPGRNQDARDDEPRNPPRATFAEDDANMSDSASHEDETAAEPSNSPAVPLPTRLDDAVSIDSRRAKAGTSVRWDDS